MSIDHIKERKVLVFIWNDKNVFGKVFFDSPFDIDNFFSAFSVRMERLLISFKS